jgi:uncharacterized membrane protein (DUF373 family)
MVSGYVYFVAFTLVLYMVSTLITGVLGVVTGLADLSLSAKSILTSPQRSTLELELLHTIAFTIVLVKAYKILIAYAETRHINIKFLVEIAIIAPTIELIFNAKGYSLETNMLFAAFAFANLVVYLFFYSTIKTVSHDYIVETCPQEQPPAKPKRTREKKA